MALLDFANGLNEVRERTREIEALDDDEPGNIGQAMLAVCIHEDAEGQAPFLKALKLAATDCAKEQNDSRWRA